MQKQKIGKISIFSSLDIKLEFLTNQVELTQFSVESNRVELKIWATWLESSWKCEQFDSISIQVQNVNLKLNSMISLHSLFMIESKFLWFILQINHAVQNLFLITFKMSRNILKWDFNITNSLSMFSYDFVMILL